MTDQKASKDSANTEQQAAMSARHAENESLSALARKMLWADNPAAVHKVVIGLAVLSALLFIIDLFYHRHAYFSVEQTSAFYAIVGFVAFTLIVLLAGQLRRVIKRDENYYAERSVHGEDYPRRDLELKAHDSSMPGHTQRSGGDQS